MRRAVLALVIVVLAGAPQAFRCMVSCAEQSSITVSGHHHHHDEHAEHRSSSAVADVELAAMPHDCGRADQLARVAEQVSKVKFEQNINSSIIPLTARTTNSPTFFVVVSQRPPGSQFLSIQLRT